MKISNYLCIIFCAIISVGCSHIEYRQVEGSFAGLKTSVDEHHPLKLLVVHGMGRHKPGYAEGLTDALAKEMKLSPQFKYSIQEIRSGTGTESQNSSGRVYGYLRIQDYKDSQKATVLRVYELTWSPTTQSIKDQFLGFDSLGKYSKHRIFLNHQLKEQLMNERMSEPVMYIGKYRPEMQYPIKWAIRRLLDDPFGEGKEDIVIITASLASYMTYDILTTLGSQSEDQGMKTETLCAKLKSIIMLANQIPLLLMSEVRQIGGQLGNHEEGAAPVSAGETIPGATWFDRSVLNNFIALRKSAYEKQAPGQPIPEISIVAVNDPNDVLTYALPGYLDRDDDYVNYVNVTLNIAKIRWSTLLANPVTAHTGHEDNTDVIHFLVTGEFIHKPNEPTQEPLLKTPSLTK